MSTEQLGADNLNKAGSFWKHFLQGTTSATSLSIKQILQPGSLAEPKFQSQTASVSESACLLLNSFLKEHQIAPQVLLIGVWGILLSRYSNEQDMVFWVQVPSLCLSKDELESDADPLFPVRIQIGADQSLVPWLVKLQAQWLTLQAYQQTPLTQIYEWSGLSTEELSTKSLLLLSEHPKSQIKDPQLSDDPTVPEQISCPLIVQADVAKFTLQLQYDRTQFDDAAIARLASQFQTLVEGCANNPQQSIQELPWLTAAEQHQLLHDWAVNRVEYPREATIPQLFEAQVDRTPEAIAVVLPTLEGITAQQLTYRALNERANILAAHLQTLGVQRGTFVAIAMERTIELIVAIVGILKAGGVYVPIDPSYPAERIVWMLADSQAPVILSQSHLIAQLPPHAAQIVCLDAHWGASATPATPQPCNLTATDLAYVNYTSGSTGKPKGVAIPHRGVVRLVLGTDFTPLDGTQTFLQLAPISFDAATFEIWGALLHGGRCVLYPASSIPDSHLLKTILWEQQVTTLFLTTALFNTLVAEIPDALLPVREVLTGGEAISIPSIRQALAQLPETALIHVYGPTKSTTFACSYRIPRQIDASLTTLPIGKPIGNTELYILDERLQPVPIGVPGELYVGGDGLAQEYLNRPDLTQERFIPHPFSPASDDRLYKTGDQVRYLPDGNVEFIGRQDNQVKIRGFRIELGEVESVLRQHEAVRDVRVILREDLPGDKRLVAYLTAQENHPVSIQDLQAYLRARLAAFMIPDAMLLLNHLPLSPTGKVDCKALPAPARGGVPEQYIAPSNSLERSLAELWASVLGLAQVGVEDNFFDLGGTSLLGMQLITRIQKHYDSDFRSVMLYQYPTVRALAQYLGAAREADQFSPAVAPPRSTTATDGIAIVGMAGQFPGASSVAELWQNLCAGIESTTFFSDAELDASVPAELRSDPNYVPAKGSLRNNFTLSSCNTKPHADFTPKVLTYFLTSPKGVVAGAETFDAAFFGISPREAEVMDPQARVFLELAYTALENAGYTPEAFAGQIGLYAGSGQNTYFERHLCGRSEIIDRLGAFQAMLGNEKDFVTTRTSYKLNLTGPSLSINTACSTSLVAVIQSFYGLISGQCDNGYVISAPSRTVLLRFITVPLLI